MRLGMGRERNLVNELVQIFIAQLRPGSVLTYRELEMKIAGMKKLVDMFNSGDSKETSMAVQLTQEFIAKLDSEHIESFTAIKHVLDDFSNQLEWWKKQTET